jgi:hypothetical protein
VKYLKPDAFEEKKFVELTALEAESSRSSVWSLVRVPMAISQQGREVRREKSTGRKGQACRVASIYNSLLS